MTDKAKKTKMIVMCALWLVIVLLIISTIVTIAIFSDKKNKPYNEFENKMVEATKKYVEIDFSYPEEGTEKKVLLNDLINTELITSNKVDDDECFGYVIVSKKTTTYSYKAYIKCNNYTTNNY